MGAFESGQSFIAGVLAKLPESLRAQAEAVFSAAEAKEAVAQIGDGALARSDYSRSMDALRSQESELTGYYERLNGWYADNKSALDRARELVAAGGTSRPQPAPAPAPAPAPTAMAGLSPEEIRAIANDAINEAGKDYIAVTAFLGTQGGRHSHLFGEPLDMNELVANPKLGRPIAGQPGRIFSLQDAYTEKYGDRLAAKQKEAEDQRINAEVEKRLSDRTRATATHPFPLRAEASPLDVLTTKDGSAAHTLDSAVAEYERLQSARGA